MRYYCNECKKTISKVAYDFSMGKYNRALCKAHQRATKATLEARKVYEALRKRVDYNIELEKWDKHKHIDIAIVEAKVNIEVDGPKHIFNKKQALSDLKRTFYSFKKGYVTLRIPNELVKDQETLEETADYIAEFLHKSKEQLDDY